MNITYAQYLEDQRIRADIMSAARLARSRAIGRFLFGWISIKGKEHHAAGTHLARQG